VVVFAGSAKGLVHGESAMVAPDDDARALGEGILAVLGDPALAARLGRNARRFVEANFGWPVLAERTLDVYRQLVRRPSASAS
jgi:glycosyltransferase involved in cell wall biosynthesis